ncbi:hypothetical protein Chor_015796, partial [Crotalus horridus]
HGKQFSSGVGVAGACATRDPFTCGLPARAGGSARRSSGRSPERKELEGSSMAGQAFKKFLPLFDRVLVERCASETVTKGGIMIPEKSQGKVLQATVVADGNTHPVSVKVGEKVLLPEYGGTKVILDDKVSFTLNVHSFNSI